MSIWQNNSNQDHLRRHAEEEIAKDQEASAARSGARGQCSGINKAVKLNCFQGFRQAPGLGVVSGGPFGGS